jgi:CRISPR/Cas system-associated exonuclease Cas4 (RecB family)
MSIQQLIDNALIKEEELKSKKVRSGKFSPSSFGRCYRYQFWNRKNEAKSNPVDVGALRRFKVGNIIHAYAQSFFPQAQREVIILGGDDLVGYADIVLENEVVDIKSCRSYEFKLFLKKDFDVKVGKFQNCLQVCTYALYLNKPQARLIFIEKDALDSKEFVIETKDFKKDIEEELEILRGFWKQDKLPAPLPRAYGGKECGYCAFKNKCLTMEGKTIEIIKEA